SRDVCKMIREFRPRGPPELSSSRTGLHSASPPATTGGAAMPHSDLPRFDPDMSLALALVESSQSPVLLLDAKLGIVGASRSFCAAFGFEPEAIAGTRLGDLGAGEWD